MNQRLSMYRGMACYLINGWNYANYYCTLQTFSGTIFSVPYWELDTIRFSNKPNKGNQ